MFCARPLCCLFVLIAACDVATEGAKRDAGSEPAGALEDGGPSGAGSGNGAEAGAPSACEPDEVRVDTCGKNQRGQMSWVCSAGEWSNQGCVDPDACFDGDTQSSSDACGPNGKGRRIDDCVRGQWQVGASCMDSDECVNDSVRTGSTACGSVGDGRRQQRCEQGLWVDSEVCLLPVRCEPLARRPGETVCGINLRGLREQVCSNNHWIDSAVCIDPDECLDGSGQPGHTPCGLNGRGTLRKECKVGKLVDTTSCSDPDECTDGVPRERAQACGVNGRGTAVDTCVKGHYTFSRCADSDLCRDGDSRTGDTACGVNARGRLTQTCVRGAWRDTLSCQDADECTDGDARELPNSCGLNGRGSRRESCVSGKYVQSPGCTDPDECIDGASEVVACAEGVEGERPRLCARGKWSTGDCRCSAHEHRTCDGSCEAWPSVVHVRAESTGCEDGRSFETAFRALEDGLAITRAGTDVWLARGVYRQRNQRSFRLPAGARLLGGFAGDEKLADLRDPATHKSVLTGTSTSERVLEVLNANDIAGSLVSGIEFRDAKQGALLVTGPMEVRDSLFSNNRADGDGGAIAARGATLSISRSRFVSNEGSFGGAIHSSASGRIEVRDCELRDNRALVGAGIHANRRALILRTRFVGNAATQTGGALFVGGSRLHELDVYQSWFEGNSAVQRGGAIDAAGGISSVIDSVLVNNRSTGEAGVGGAIAIHDGADAWLEHLTVVGNAAELSAGGVFVVNDGGAEVINSLFSANTAPRDPQLSLDARRLILFYNLIEGGVSPERPNILAERPIFVPGSYELDAASPGVDFGVANYLAFDREDLDGDGERAEFTPVDILGRPRMVGSPDVGAFERQVP